MENLFTIETPQQTCRKCKHRERWECGSMVISYCKKKHSNKTDNGLMKIKAGNPACIYYEQ